MTDPTARDLIQRLLTVLGKDYAGTALEVEARAYLATPEPAAGPTLDDILELCAEHEFMLGIDGANEEESANGLFEIVRAVLARYGRQPPQPNPLSERLPGPEDCFFNPGATIGSCWCFHPVDCLGGIAWWSFEPIEWTEDATHWLPHHALPLPEAP